MAFSSLNQSIVSNSRKNKTGKVKLSEIQINNIWNMLAILCNLSQHCKINNNNFYLKCIQLLIKQNCIFIQVFDVTATYVNFVFHFMRYINALLKIINILYDSAAFKIANYFAFTLQFLECKIRSPMIVTCVQLFENI